MTYFLHDFSQSTMVVVAGATVPVGVEWYNLPIKFMSYAAFPTMQIIDLPFS